MKEFFFASCFITHALVDLKKMKKTMNQQMDITCAKVNAAEAKQNFTDC